MKSHLISKGITLIAIEWLKLGSTYGTNWQTYPCKTPCPNFFETREEKNIVLQYEKRAGREGFLHDFSLNKFLDLNSLSCVSLLFEEKNPLKFSSDLINFVFSTLTTCTCPVAYITYKTFNVLYKDQ